MKTTAEMISGEASAENYQWRDPRPRIHHSILIILQLSSSFPRMEATCLALIHESQKIVMHRKPYELPILSYLCFLDYYFFNIIHYFKLYLFFYYFLLSYR